MLSQTKYLLHGNSCKKSLVTVAVACSLHNFLTYAIDTIQPQFKRDQSLVGQVLTSVDCSDHGCTCTSLGSHFRCEDLR